MHFSASMAISFLTPLIATNEPEAISLKMAAPVNGAYCTLTASNPRS